MDISYEIQLLEAEITVGELLKDYYNKEYFETLCRKCPNYGRLWSCPPYDFSPIEYLQGYERLTVLGMKLLLPESLRRETLLKEDVAEVTEAIMREAKEQRDAQLLRTEKSQAHCRMLSSGGCRLCSRCARESGMPCRQKGRMRYSLESLGCDVTRLAKDKLSLELLWAGERLPEYFVLVNGLLWRETT